MTNRSSYKTLGIKTKKKLLRRRVKKLGLVCLAKEHVIFFEADNSHWPERRTFSFSEILFLKSQNWSITATNKPTATTTSTTATTTTAAATTATFSTRKPEKTDIELQKIVTSEKKFGRVDSISWNFNDWWLFWQKSSVYKFVRFRRISHRIFLESDQDFGEQQNG